MKKLSEKKREELYEQIKKEAVAYAICEVDNVEIEKYNMENSSDVINGITTVHLL